MAIKIIREATKIFITECHNCECEFQYEVSDVQRGLSYSYVSCPHCDAMIPHNSRKRYSKENTK